MSGMRDEGREMRAEGLNGAFLPASPLPIPHPSSLIPQTTLGGLGGEGHRVQLPAVEAIPAELVGGPNLVRKAERVGPTLLFSPPPAIPRELNHAALSTTLDHSSPDEVGAARTGVHLHSIDHPFRMGMEQVRDQTDDLDPRDGTHERDGRHIVAGREGNDIALEAIGRAGARENFRVDWHGRNISEDRHRLGTSSRSNKTKLTGKSAPERRGGLRQW